MTTATPSDGTVLDSSAGPVVTRRRARGSVTVAEIAAAAGVSVSTVSKVLNGNAGVSQASRQRVQAVLLRRQFQRRAFVRSGTPPVIDVVFTEIGSPWAAEIARGAVRAAAEAGLAVAVTSRPESSGRQSWLDRIMARGTHGVVLVQARLAEHAKSELRSRGLAFAVIDPRGEPDPSVLTIGATNWSGGLAATRHLIELKHRRIGVISGPPDLLCSRARLDGYRSAIEAAGLKLDAQIMRWSDLAVEGGFREAMAMLDLPKPPSAIFAASDLQALGVLEAARLRQVRVPAQLSLVGFDDLPLSRWSSPPLTTVRQPLARMASTAVHMVLAQAGGEGSDYTSVELSTTLVTRKTTAPYRRSTVGEANGQREGKSPGISASAVAVDAQAAPE